MKTNKTDLIKDSFVKDEKVRIIYINNDTGKKYEAVSFNANTQKLFLVPIYRDLLDNSIITEEKEVEAWHINDYIDNFEIYVLDE